MDHKPKRVVPFTFLFSGHGKEAVKRCVTRTQASRPFYRVSMPEEPRGVVQANAYDTGNKDGESLRSAEAAVEGKSK